MTFVWLSVQDLLCKDGVVLRPAAERGDCF